MKPQALGLLRSFAAFEYTAEPSVPNFRNDPHAAPPQTPNLHPTPPAEQHIEPASSLAPSWNP